MQFWSKLPVEGCGNGRRNFGWSSLIMWSSTQKVVSHETKANYLNLSAALRGLQDPGQADGGSSTVGNSINASVDLSTL